MVQTDLEGFIERIGAKLPTPTEFDALCREENLCAYELSKRLIPHARLITAPYAFFFHPHIRRALYQWMGVGPDRVDLVIDEAHNLPSHLRELASVVLPQESVRRARSEVAERGDFQLPDGPSATRFFDIVGAAVEELVQALVREDDAVLPPTVFEDALLTALGGTSHRLDTWLGALATWGENLRDERRRERHLPRSWVHTVALTLLSWPQLEPPSYVKVATRTPRAALEAFSLDASIPAQPIRECHLSVHLSGTLAPLEEDPRRARACGGGPPPGRPVPFPSREPTLSLRHVRHDPVPGPPAGPARDRPPRGPARRGDLGPVRSRRRSSSRASTCSTRPSRPASSRGFPGTSSSNTRRCPSGDLWRSIEGWKRDPEGTVLLGVAGGRLAEGIDYPDEELEAVVIVGIPYPKPTARREALRRFLDSTTGRGWEYTVEAPAARAIVQACGRMIRSENDRGLAIILDKRAPTFSRWLPGLEPIGDLAATTRTFYGGRRARWSPSKSRSTGNAPADPAHSPP